VEVIKYFNDVLGSLDTWSISQGLVKEHKWWVISMGAIWLGTRGTCSSTSL